MSKEKGFRKKLIICAKVTLSMMLISLLLVFNVPIPIRIETVAFEIALENPNHAIERTVVISGWYRINLFVPYNRFSGSIQISGYDTTNQAMDALKLHRNRGAGYRFDLLFFNYSEITDSADNADSHTRKLFGAMHSRLMFRDAFIIVSCEGYINTFDSPLVVLNATNRSSAVAILRNFGIYE